MNDHHKTFIAFVKLGTFLRDFCNGRCEEYPWAQKLEEGIILAGHKNGWFTVDNIRFALKNWGDQLTQEKLGEWLTGYGTLPIPGKKVALVMAGNIPMVGFHDFLSVVITGHSAMIKSAANDNVLIKFIIEYLIASEPLLKEKITIVDGKMAGFDAVIATGSNNTARYFEHYFQHVPNIIRKNRNSVAVLDGQETKEQLLALGTDIFQYYGLGCRSVSKIFVPEGYRFDHFFEAIYPFHPIVDQLKYANNYDYNKAVYLMSEFKLFDNGFLMLKEDQSYASPIASLFYEYYPNATVLKLRLENDADQLQCIVSNNFIEGEVAFGQTQTPALSDYADQIDTVDFLLKI